MRRKSILKRIFAFIIALSATVIMLTNSSFAASLEKFNMSYVYFGNSNAYTSLVDDTRGSLNDISPSWFDLNTDGTLKLNASLNTNFINTIHTKGIKVTPFLSNHWNRQNGIEALKNKELLATSIAEAVVNYNLDGINVDIENLTINECDSYTEFVRLLREKLPVGKSLSIAVATSIYDTATGWAASYDYEELAKYCDYLMLMAYDEHYQGSAQGPVASAPFVEKSIQYALKRVSSDKILLGIAFYGRYWKQGTAYGGYGISNSTVEELIKKYRGVVTYDKATQSPMAVITIKSSDTKPYVLGKTLSAGKYTIWYENEQSIKYKLQLVKKYNLKGTGSWSLGQETISTWDYYSLWLNGFYFTDAEGNWALRSIISVANKGWMLGVSSTNFLPNASLTRAEAATIIVRALGLTGASESLNYESFSDTVNHWAEDEIDIAKQNNIISGIGNGKFGPDLPVTRAQIAVMLDRALTQLQIVNGAGSIFSDVTESNSAWAYDSIIKMSYYSIINGYPDGNYYPSYKITRAQMAAVMDRASGYIDSEITLASNESIN